MTSLKFLRNFDKFVGNGACRVLLLHKRLAGKGGRVDNLPILPKKIRRIVIIKMFGLGSILIITPILRALKKAYPTARITLITLEQNKVMAKSIGLLDEIIALPQENIFCTIKEFLTIAFHLRKQKPDLVLDFEFFVGATAILTYLSDGKFKIGFGTDRIRYRDKLYDKTVAFNQKEHILTNFFHFVKPELLKHTKVDDRMEMLETTPNDAKYVSNVLKSHGITRDEKIICININTSEIAYERRWPQDRFISVAKKILNHYPDAVIIFIGGKQDKKYVTDALQMLKQEQLKSRTIDLSGKLSLQQLQLLFMKTELLITNDSGPMHLAAATGMKEICLFGPESPTRYAPLNKNSIIIYKRLHCSPCMNVYDRKKIKCHRKAECMKNITVSEVFEKIKSALED